MFVKLVFNVLKLIEILSSAQVIKFVRSCWDPEGVSEISSSQVQLTKAKRSNFNPSLQIYI